MINLIKIKQSAYLNRFILFAVLALLFSCTAPELPLSDAELNSALQVTPASPVIPPASATAPTALPSKAEAEAAIKAAAEAEVEANTESAAAGYPAPADSGSAVVEPEQVASNIQNLDYPAPEQVLQDSPVVPTVSVIDVASVANSSETDSSQDANVAEPILGQLQPDGSIALGWADLIPADFTADSIYQKYQEKLADIAPGDPKAQELQAQMQEEFNNAPPNEALNGKLVRVPGFITPLDYADDAINEFLLVPYFGACIHVPAPPTNQTVFVSTATGDEVDVADAFGPIWVIGVLQTESTTTDLATAGYTIVDAKIELYSD